MFDDLIWILLLVLVVVGVLLFGVIRLIWYLVKNKRNAAGGTPDHLRLALSPEDAVSQLLVVLALAFLTLGLLAFDRQLGYPVPWQTLFGLVSALAIVVGYRQKLLYLAVLGGIGAMIWFGAQGGIWADTARTQTVGILVGIGWLGLVWYIAGAFLDQLPQWRRFATSGYIIGTIIPIALLFFLSTNWGLEALVQFSSGYVWYGAWGVSVLLVVAFLLVAIPLGIGAARNVLKRSETIALASVALLFGVLLCLGANINLFSDTYDYYGAALSGLGISLALVYNIGIFAALVAVVMSGYIRHESWRISLGAVLMFVLILIKYFDWFFTFLDKSAFFLGAGLILFIVGAMMERGRKYMIASMEQNKTA